MKSMRLRSPTDRSSPAGRSTWRRRSRGASCRRCRMSAARSRCSPVASSFPIAATMAIAATITGSSSAFPRADPAKVESFATRARGGGIWGQGGVTGDGKSLFVATGNTFGASAWSDGEAVLRFGPGLARPVDPRDYFAPSNWSCARWRRSGPRRNRAHSARRSERQRRSKAHLRHRQDRRRLPSRSRQSRRDRPRASRPRM